MTLVPFLINQSCSWLTPDLPVAGVFRHHSLLRGSEHGKLESITSTHLPNLYEELWLQSVVDFGWLRCLFHSAETPVPHNHVNSISECIPEHHQAINHSEEHSDRCKLSSW